MWCNHVVRAVFAHDARGRAHDGAPHAMQVQDITGLHQCAQHAFGSERQIFFCDPAARTQLPCDSIDTGYADKRRMGAHINTGRFVTEDRHRMSGAGLRGGQARNHARWTTGGGVHGVYDMDDPHGPFASGDSAAADSVWARYR